MEGTVSVFQSRFREQQLTVKPGDKNIHTEDQERKACGRSLWCSVVTVAVQYVLAEMHHTGWPSAL